MDEMEELDDFENEEAYYEEVSYEDMNEMIEAKRDT